MFIFLHISIFTCSGKHRVVHCSLYHFLAKTEPYHSPKNKAAPGGSHGISIKVFRVLWIAFLKRYMGILKLKKFLFPHITSSSDPICHAEIGAVPKKRASSLPFLLKNNNEKVRHGNSSLICKGEEKSGSAAE